MNKKDDRVFITIIVILLIIIISTIFILKLKNKNGIPIDDLTEIMKAENTSEKRPPTEVELGEIDYEEDENPDEVGDAISKVLNKLEEDKEIKKKIMDNAKEADLSTMDKGDIIVSLKGIKDIELKNSEGEQLVYSIETDSYAFSENMDFDFKRGSQTEGLGNTLILHNTQEVRIDFNEQTEEDDFITIIASGTSVGIKGKNIYNIKVDQVGNLSIGSGNNYTATFQIDNNYYKYITISNTGTSPFNMSISKEGYITLNGIYINNAVIMYTDKEGNSKEIKFDKSNYTKVYELSILDDGQIEVMEENKNKDSKLRLIKSESYKESNIKK